MVAVLFGDAVAGVIGHVSAVFAGLAPVESAPVVSVVPSARPARFVTVQRTGGPRETMVTEAAQLTVDAWGSSQADAHDLSQQARRAIHGLPGVTVGGVGFYAVAELGGPQFVPDPDSEQARFRFTVSIHCRCLAA